MLDLLVGQHLVNAVDRSAWNSCRIEPLDPIRAGALDSVAFDLGVDGVTVFRAVRRSREVGALKQFGCSKCDTKSLPNPATGGGDIDIAIIGLEHAGRNTRRMIVAGLFCDLA